MKLHRLGSPRLAVFAIAALAGATPLACRRTAPPSAGSTGVDARAPDTAPVPTRATDAAAPRADAALPSDPPSGARLLSQLGCVATRVSSAAAHAPALQSMRTDRSDVTPWITRDGNTVGAWVEFDVPEGLEVAAVQLVLGGPVGTAPRPQRFRITLDGAAVAEPRIDPGSTRPQFVALHAPAGLVRLEVTEVAPGTDPSLRALDVADVTLWGSALPGARTGSCSTTATVGPRAGTAYNGGNAEGPYADLDHYCTHWRGHSAGPAATDGGATDGAVGDAGADPTAGAGAFCQHALQRTVGDAAASVVDWPDGPDRAPPSDPVVALVRTRAAGHSYVDCGLALRAPSGWFVAPRVFRCGGSTESAGHTLQWNTTVLGLQVGAGDGGVPTFAVHYNERGQNEECNYEGGRCYGTNEVFVVRCRLGPSGRAVCAPAHVSALPPDAIR